MHSNPQGQRQPQNQHQQQGQRQPQNQHTKGESKKVIQWFTDDNKTDDNKTEDNKKTIRPELLDEEAKKEAKDWLDGERGNKEFTKSQLRRYYNEVKNLERQLKALSDTKTGWDNVYPMVKMLKSKIAYDKNRENSKIPDAFENFIRNCVDSIKTEEDFKAFVKHFEACVGFFKGKEK